MKANAYYNFLSNHLDWREAIGAACRPLKAAGVDAEALAAAITASVDRYGPFFIASPGLAVLWAEDGAGSDASEADGERLCPDARFPKAVNGRPALSVLRTATPVSFDPEDPACAADILVVPFAPSQAALAAMSDKLVWIFREGGLAERIRRAAPAEGARIMAEIGLV